MMTTTEAKERYCQRIAARKARYKQLERIAKPVLLEMVDRLIRVHDFTRKSRQEELIYAVLEVELPALPSVTDSTTL